MGRVVVFGYGAVGREIATQLAARGDEVTVSQRHEPPALAKGLRFVPCDITHPEAVVRACAGQDTVICAVGFPYDRRVWEVNWPPAMRALMAGCAAAGARFVFADTLYALGPQTAPLTEDMPLTSYGRKPRVRAEVTRIWIEAHAAGRVRAAAARASDFYGPDVPHSVLSVYGVERMLAGRPAVVPYSPDFPHDFTYVPDYARAVTMLVDAPDDAYGQAWNVPNAATRTLRQLLELAAALAGVRARIVVIPAWAQPALALFAPALREIPEMRFQWDRPYLVDASKFVARFGDIATPFERGLAETIRFYRRPPR